MDGKEVEGNQVADNTYCSQSVCNFDKQLKLGNLHYRLPVKGNRTARTGTARQGWGYLVAFAINAKAIAITA